MQMEHPSNTSQLQYYLSKLHWPYACDLAVTDGEKMHMTLCTINVEEHNVEVSPHGMADPQVMDGGDSLQV
jgi:hypothetical protein